MVLTLSKFSKISETKNNKHSLRLRAEVGRSEFVKAHMRENDGERPSQEEQDKHERWQTLFVISEDKEPLQKLLNKLRHGKRRSLIARFDRKPFEWEGRFGEGENLKVTQNLTTGIRYLSGYDEDIKQFVPVQALCR